MNIIVLKNITQKPLAILLGMSLLAVTWMVAPTSASAEDAMITSPTAGEIIYQNDLTLSGHDEAAAYNTVRWALRAGTCAASTGTVAGNVDGYNDPSDWVSGYFTAELDLSELDAGLYCFVLNTEQGPAVGSRLTQTFYIVDGYAKIGGNVDNEDYLSNNPLAVPLKGKQLSHALSGVIGDAGAAGIVGSFSANYRQLKEQIHFTPVSMTFSADAGSGVTDPTKRVQINMDNGSRLFLADKDASRFDRGGVVFRYAGNPGTGIYEIDGTPGTTGAASWIGMANGNVHVGMRN